MTGLYQCLDCKRVFTDDEINKNIDQKMGIVICPECKGGNTNYLGEIAT